MVIWPSHSSVTRGVLRWLGFSRSWYPEYQDVLVSIHERPLQQRTHLLHHLDRQTLQVQRRPALLQRQPRRPQQPFDATLLPLLTLTLGQAQQVLLVAQRLLLRLPGQFLVARPERRQVQFLQTAHQPLPYL